MRNEKRVGAKDRYLYFTVCAMSQRLTGQPTIVRLAILDWSAGTSMETPSRYTTQWKIKSLRNRGTTIALLGTV